MGKKIYITESQLDYIIKNVDLLTEQVDTQPTQSPEGEVKENFDASFSDNMISFNPDESREAYNKFFTAISRKQKAGEIIKGVTLQINSSASSARATNKLPNGVTKPDHTYGGKVPTNLWTTVDKRLSESEVDKLPEGYTPQQGYYPIKGGNEFLAMNRGLQLQKYLKNVLIQTYKVSESVITSPDPVWQVNQPKKSVNARMSIESQPFEERWGTCYKGFIGSVNAMGKNKVFLNYEGSDGGAVYGSLKFVDFFNHLQNHGPTDHWNTGKGSMIGPNVNTTAASEKFYKLALEKANGKTLFLNKNLEIFEELLIASVGEDNFNPACSKIMRKRKFVEKK
jgi:hypothetical protein